MLNASQIKAGYSGKMVLQGVDIAIPSGAIHGLVGSNGAGKTTLFNVLYGFHPATSGKLYFEDRPLRRKDVGYLETHNFFYSAITGREYLRLFPGTGDTTFDEDGWGELFQLPLEEWVDHYSTGMKKKLALLAVVKSDQPLLLLDEPFNGLDLESQYLLRELLLRLRSKGKTILVSSHILESLLPVCDGIHWLHDGIIRQFVEPGGYADFSQLLEAEIQLQQRKGLDKVI